MVRELQYMLYLFLSDVHDATTESVASHLGKAQGIVTMLRAVPYHAQRNQCYLPIDLMMHVSH